MAGQVQESNGSFIRFGTSMSGLGQEALAFSSAAGSGGVGNSVGGDAPQEDDVGIEPVVEWALIGGSILGSGAILAGAAAAGVALASIVGVVAGSDVGLIIGGE